MAAFKIRRAKTADHPWVVKVLTENWASTRIVTRGRLFDADRLPAFIAVEKRRRIGLITYRIEGAGCEITSLNSLKEGIGVGGALVLAVKFAAVERGCSRLWLITTNDNLRALWFYQRRGFTLAAAYLNALSEARKLKLQIPRIGMDGIPLRDEIELDMDLRNGPGSMKN